jgi:hypothetical protein
MTDNDTSAWPKFYDSVSGDFPPGADRFALYADGDHPYSSLGKPLPAGLVRWITVDGSPGDFIADYEPGNPVYTTDAMRLWAERRLAAGGQRAVAYSDRYDLAGLAAELGPILFGHPRLLFWIPTLDNMQWTPAQLSAEIVDDFNVFIPPERIWANQYANEGAWDVSNLFGVWA